MQSKEQEYFYHPQMLGVNVAQDSLAMAGGEGSNYSTSLSSFISLPPLKSTNIVDFVFNIPMYSFGLFFF